MAAASFRSVLDASSTPSSAGGADGLWLASFDAAMPPSSMTMSLCCIECEAEYLVVSRTLEWRLCIQLKTNLLAFPMVSLTHKKEEIRDGTNWLVNLPGCQYIEYSCLEYLCRPCRSEVSTLSQAPTSSSAKHVHELKSSLRKHPRNASSLHYLAGCSGV
jgi:hypothetical protein